MLCGRQHTTAIGFSWNSLSAVQVRTPNRVSCQVEPLLRVSFMKQWLVVLSGMPSFCVWWHLAPSLIPRIAAFGTKQHWKPKTHYLLMPRFAYGYGESVASLKHYLQIDGMLTIIYESVPIGNKRRGPYLSKIGWPEDWPHVPTWLYTVSRLNFLQDIYGSKKCPRPIFIIFKYIQQILRYSWMFLDNAWCFSDIHSTVQHNSRATWLLSQSRCRHHSLRRPGTPKIPDTFVTLKAHDLRIPQAACFM